MKALLSCKKIPTLFRVFSLTLRPQLLRRALRSFSSTSPGKPRWNSITKVIITNPLLLILESCTSMLHLKQVQAQMTISGIITHTFPVSRVLAFCALADSGDIHYAQILFWQIERPNTYIWNTMIRGYSRARFPQMGVLYFKQMMLQRMEMDSRSFVFALKACKQSGREFEGNSIHCLIWKTGFDADLLVRNGLIHFYTEIGCLSFARRVFDRSPVRDVFTWTTMIDGYAAHKCLEDALNLFDLMSASGVEPNEVTMIAMMSVCAQEKDVAKVKMIHEYIKINNVYNSLNLLNAMLDMYVKCGLLVQAREIFEKMKVRDVYSWTSLLNGYAKCGDLESARKLFDEMPERNVISWNSIIAGYSQNDKPKEALELFNNMTETGMVPTENTLVCILSACSKLGCLDLGKWIHDYYIKGKQTKLSTTLANSLIVMYAKCGKIDSAGQLFYEMEERDLVSWNSMIGGYAIHGDAKQALALFEQMKMEGWTPEDVTFLGVLSACNHGGLLLEGQQHFKEMELNFGLKPREEHYACMIDILGRFGRLEEAYELLTKMPMTPNVAAWGALLNASSMQEDIELAKVAAERLIELDPTDSGTYALLASTCARGRRWGDVRNVRRMMRERGVKKSPGQCLVEVEGVFHEFLVADNSHPQSEEIYTTLQMIYLQSKYSMQSPSLPS